MERIPPLKKADGWRKLGSVGNTYPWVVVAVVTAVLPFFEGFAFSFEAVGDRSASIEIDCVDLEPARAFRSAHETVADTASIDGNSP